MIKLSKKIFLASGSPRRKELLNKLGFPFEVKSVDVDESFGDVPPEAVAGYLAEKKARAFEDLNNDILVLSADTVVILNGKVLGKPVDREDAVAMLKAQSGSVQHVYTSVCLRDGDRYLVETDIAEVRFRVLTEREINYYVENDQPYDKAGAYGIQEWIGMIGVDAISGSFYTIMGLPTHLVYQMLLPYSL